MEKRLDLVIVGGGISGSALAIVMARAGYRVVLLEREARFRDRVRGEVTFPWGAAELAALGLIDEMLAGCARGILWHTDHIGGVTQPRISYPDLSRYRRGAVTFPHPEMQEQLLRMAEAAGATVHRPATLRDFTPGKLPRVVFEADGAAQEITARLIVGADGRESHIRRAAGFALDRDPEHLYTAGFQLRGIEEEPASVHFFLDVGTGCGSVVIETAPANHRAYLLFHKDALDHRPSGARDYPFMMDRFRQLGFPEAWLEGAEPHSILASFDGAHRWVDHAHRDGVALLGDAAACSDPVFGNGLSRCFREVRILRDCLLDDPDWTRAAEAFAVAQHAAFQNLRRLERLSAELNFSLGDVARARRARASELQAREPELAFRISLDGPDKVISDADMARLLA